jgi:hypothetical protein
MRGAWTVSGAAVCIAHGGAAGQVHEAAQRRCACKRIEDGFGALLAEYEDANPDPLQGLVEVVTRTVRMVQTIRARMDELSAGSLDPLVDTPPSNELLCSSTDLQPKSPRASQNRKNLSLPSKTGYSDL